MRAGECGTSRTEVREMTQRLLISGDNPEAVETIRRIAEEGGLAVTALDRDGPRPTTHEGRRDDECEAEWTWRDDHAAYERQREALGREYRGQYIAMHRGKVIGVGESAREAAREGLDRLGRPAALFAVKAGEPLPEADELDMPMEAPRSVETEQ
jgi:hypothetical protein